MEPNDERTSRWSQSRSDRTGFWSRAAEELSVILRAGDAARLTAHFISSIGQGARDEGVTAPETSMTVFHGLGRGAVQTRDTHSAVYFAFFLRWHRDPSSIPMAPVIGGSMSFHERYEYDRELRLFHVAIISVQRLLRTRSPKTARHPRDLTCVQSQPRRAGLVQ